MPFDTVPQQNPGHAAEPGPVEFDSPGAELPENIRAELRGMLPDRVNKVHVLTYEHTKGAHRTSCVATNPLGQWFHMVVSWRRLTGVSSRVAVIREGSARALLSHRDRTGSPLPIGVLSPISEFD